ncbi:hypothetical protein BDV06DRAFT_210291 [Aspergillus oleicola]
MPEMADMPAPLFSPSALTVSPSRVDPPLRSSCSQCNQAKVKCSKDRPTCRRCATRNTPCVYGVSLRGVKRPRPDQQADQARQPSAKKRATSVSSPILSEHVPTTAIDMALESAQFPEWNNNGDPYSDSFLNDDLDLSTLLSLNSLDASVPDPSSFSFQLDLASPQPSSTQPWVAPQAALPPLTFPLSPISPPGSRDGQLDLTPAASCSKPAGPCTCQQTITYKLAQLGVSKPPHRFNLQDFLVDHRANMALCATVLNCTDPQHTPGMLLLLPLIALLNYMTAAFDQILQGGDTSQAPTTAVSAPVSPSEYRKEQVSQANTLRAELAKLGALIQQFDRRYCSIDNACFGEDTFLLSPLFSNLQWKTQAKFDAARSWMPRL